MRAKIDQVQLPARRWLGHLRRFFRAVFYALTPTRASYASHRDDVEIFDFVIEKLRQGGVYLDVGANDPIFASNTYLFYRLGYRGVCIDPNADFSLFYRIFRPRDVFISGACSDRCAVMALNGDTSAISSIDVNAVPGNSLIVPVFVLDQIMDVIEIPSIALLSIDTEGNEATILGAAPRILSITQAVLVESHSPDTDRVLSELLEKYGFRLIKRVGYNLLFSK